MQSLKLVVTTNFCHPHFGGNEIKTKDFTMAEAEKAEEYYNKQREGDQGLIQFTTINIVLFDYR